MKYEKYGKKEINAILCLLTILLVAPLLNAYVQPLFYKDVMDRDSHNARYPASVDAHIEDMKNQEYILRQLAGKSDVVLSKVGKKPSQMEQFQFGVLSGKYNVTRNAGGISQLDIQPELHNKSHLKRIEDRAEFLKEYRSLWFIPFQHVEKLITVKVGNKNSEVFVLKNANQQSVGKATILSDANGGMISLNLRGFFSY